MPACSLSVAEANYAAIIERLKALSKTGGDPAELKECQQTLKAARKLLHDLVRGDKKDITADPAAAHAAYPDPCEIPVDKDGFTISFSCPCGPGAPKDPDEANERAAAKAFFERYGFVVFRGALDSERCAATREEIWSVLENQNPGLCRNDPDTYDAMSGALTYGLANDAAQFTTQIVRNRQDPRVVGALALLLDDQNVLMSHDRWCVYRPTRGAHRLAMTSEDGDRALQKVDHPEWKTRGNVHLDVHPWNFVSDGTCIEALQFDQMRDFSRELNMVSRRSGPHVQGVLALLDSRCAETNGGIEDGGTLVVPGFHVCFEQWQVALGRVEGHLASYGAYTKGDTNNWLVAREGGGASYKFTMSDPIYSLARRVPVREGDFLVWDQRMVHGSRPNDSNAFRMAQFVKAFRRAPVSEERIARRTAAIERGLRAAGSFESLTPLGRRVFGLDDNLDECEATEKDIK